MSNIFDDIMREAEAECKDEPCELESSSGNAMEAKAVIWATIAAALRDLSDDDRFDVASGTVNILKPIMVMSAVGVRDVVDEQLDILVNIEELAKESEGE